MREYSWKKHANQVENSRAGTIATKPLKNQRLFPIGNITITLINSGEGTTIEKHLVPGRRLFIYGSAMPRILVIDDHALMRMGLKHALLHAFGKVEVGEADDARTGMDLARREQWDLIILDNKMPDRDGIDILLDLRRANPKAPILILSGCSEDEFAVRGLKSGALGYIPKSSHPDEIIKAVRKVMAGERYMSASLAEKLAFGSLSDTGRAPHETLSDREFQVLRILASGKTVGKAGKDLSLSVKTISTYRTRILEKMGMSTNAELTHYAIKNKLVD